MQLYASDVIIAWGNIASYICILYEMLNVTNAMHSLYVSDVIIAWGNIASYIYVYCMKCLMLLMPCTHYMQVM